MDSADESTIELREVDGEDKLADGGLACYYGCVTLQSYRLSYRMNASDEPALCSDSADTPSRISLVTDETTSSRWRCWPCGARS